MLPKLFFRTQQRKLIWWLPPSLQALTLPCLACSWCHLSSQWSWDRSRPWVMVPITRWGAWGGWGLSALSFTGELGSCVLGRKPCRGAVPSHPVMRAPLTTVGSTHWVSPPSSCSSSPLLVLFPWARCGLSLAWTSESPRVGRIRKGLYGERSLASARIRAMPPVEGVGKLGRQTECPARHGNPHMAAFKGGCCPRGPAGSLGFFHWAHASLAWPMVEMQI